ncbi:hypothetical protein BASA60_002432 [Batrachochytrium salamandrivorans]|nr:hypothetical protein BASA60_002432 [Batrachochytrium salamandrivorans]
MSLHKNWLEEKESLALTSQSLLLHLVLPSLVPQEPVCQFPVGPCSPSSSQGQLCPAYSYHSSPLANWPIRNDEELNKLLGDVTIREGGVLPNIHNVLLPKKTKLGGKPGDKPGSPKPGVLNKFSSIHLYTNSFQNNDIYFSVSCVLQCF